MGGHDIKIAEVPFQCSLQKTSVGHFCGGAIISVDYVLTAAHCLIGFASQIVFSVSPLSFQLTFQSVSNCIHFRLGAADITIIVGTSKWTSGGTAYKVQRFIAHEEYSKKNYAFDIGLIRVEGPIKFTKYVKPIRYSSEEVPEVRGLVFVCKIQNFLFIP